MTDERTQTHMSECILKTLGWVNCAVRCIQAVRWSCALIIKYHVVRYKLSKTLGTAWVDEQLPAEPTGTLLKSAVQLIHIAAYPSVHRVAVMRARRFGKILDELRGIHASVYLITTTPGKRVYFAALTRCVNSFCGNSLTIQAMQTIHGPLDSFATGVTCYLIGWLSRYQDKSKLYWADPSPAPNISFEGSTVSKKWNCADRTSTIQGETTKQLIIQRTNIEKSAALIASQELVGVMMEQELRFLAIPTALLEACKSKTTNCLNEHGFQFGIKL